MTMYSDAAVDEFARKLGAWGAELPQEQASLLWSVLARAAAAGEQDVQGYSNQFSLEFSGLGFNKLVFGACGMRASAPEAPRGGGRGPEVPA